MCIKKYLVKSENDGIFVSTVLVLHTISTANRSFSSLESSLTNNNIPPMPLSDAHLGGFFVLGLCLKIYNYQTQYKELRNIERVFAANGLLSTTTKKGKMSITHYLVKSKNDCTFVSTVPVLHTIRTAGGSFFLYSYGK